MEQLILSNFLRLVRPLSVNSKLELASKLMEHLRLEYNAPNPTDKLQLLFELNGAWSKIDDTITDDLLTSKQNDKR